MSAGVDPSLIKNKGRWASDVYEIYCRVCKGKMLELSHLMSRADTNQWLSRNDGFFDTRAGCELGPEEEVTLSEDDGDSDSEAEVDEDSEEESAAEESEEEQDEAEEDYAADYDSRAHAQEPLDRRQTLCRRYKRHGLKFSRPPPAEPPA